jgi:hypothetical protein
MATIPESNLNQEPDDSQLEVILQRIFIENDPAAHRTAIWDLFQLSGDWELFEKVSEQGGERSISDYFQNVLDYFDEPDQEDNDSDQLSPLPKEEREGLKELYSSPILSLRRGDWAGTAASIHEILLTEIYDVYDLSEEDVSFGDATAETLHPWVSEEVLFPLSIIEYLAYSDRLTEDLNREILDNYLSILLTLFFSAQAHLESEFPPEDEPGNNGSVN